MIEVSLLQGAIVAAVQIPLDNGRREGWPPHGFAYDEVRVSAYCRYIFRYRLRSVKLICEEIKANPADTSTAGDWAKRLNVTARRFTGFLP